MIFPFEVPSMARPEIFKTVLDKPPLKHVLHCSEPERWKHGTTERPEDALHVEEMKREVGRLGT